MGTEELRTWSDGTSACRLVPEHRPSSPFPPEWVVSELKALLRILERGGKDEH